MIDPRFAILGALITFSGCAVYAVQTVRGRTQPNRVTWAMWTVAPLVAFAAELTEHVGLDALMTFAVGFGPLLVVGASFLDPKAYARLTRLDLACGGLSVLALVGWAVTGRGNVAICLSILADLFAATPTVRKAYREPHTESVAAFLADIVGAVITLLTIRAGAWGFASAAFPAYILVGASTIAVLILMPRPAADAIGGGGTDATLSRRRARRAAPGG